MCAGKPTAGWRRGVVFVRELVPRRAIALIARTLYGEPYLAVPMSHRIDHSAAGLRVVYTWRRAGRRGIAFRIRSRAATGDRQPAPEEEFITEHYWGYTKRGTRTSEYEVEHPRWKMWRGDRSRFERI